jgi:hypothetical protein
MSKKTVAFSFFQPFSRSLPEPLEEPSQVNLSPTLVEDEPRLTPLEVSAPEPGSPATDKTPSPQYFKTAAAYVATGTKSTLSGIGQAADRHKVPLIWLSFFALVGGAGIGASLWLSQVPPAADCQKISDWSADAERLFCAEQAAQSGNPDKIIESIQLVKDWQSGRPLYPQAQLLLKNWSNALLQMARGRIDQRDLKGAVALANQIPASSPVYQDAQAAIGRWKEEWNRGQRLYDNIQAALQVQNWDKASDSLAKIALLTDPVWQDRVSDLRIQVATERKAWLALQNARIFAKNNPPEKLGQAMAMTDAIGRKTMVWGKAEADVRQWRNRIFDLAATKLAKRDVVGAGALINSLPASVQVTAVGQDIIRLVRASEAELAQNNRIPNLDRVFPLLLALQSVQQIDHASPFYPSAQKLIARLEQQMQDLLQLQTAGTLANLGQLATLRAAIDQAKLVQPDRPRRVHAQTLIAEWQRNLQRLEDRPILQQSQFWAKAGSLPQLRAAVNLAGQISKKRGSYAEAQTQVAQWTAQIQTIEDRPILTQARALASDGKLEQAIATAGKIRAGRALYNEAQAAAGEWIWQLQAIVDRGTLNQATALAEQGSLTRAIDLASTIGYGRSLYNEAQSAIARWADQRAVILRARETAPIAPSGGSSSGGSGYSGSSGRGNYDPAETTPPPYDPPAAAEPVSPAPRSVEPEPAPPPLEPAPPEPTPPSP